MVTRHADARTDILSIIRTCLGYPGGLQVLLKVLRGFVGDSTALRRLEQAVALMLLEP